MIHLYKAGNNNLEFNGDYALGPISCVLEQKLNDTWQVTVELMNDGSEAFHELKKGAILGVPTPRSNKQLFRIYQTEKDDDSVIAYALPIFLDAKDDAMLMDVRPTNANGQQAMNKLCAGTKYRGVSDIIAINSAQYVRKNLVEAIASGEKNSFLNKWGGEIYYNNYTIYVMNSIAENTGMRVAFGKNMTGIKETVDDSNLITRIIPVAFNGYTLDESKPYVDSPRIKDYPIIHTKVIRYEDLKLQKDCEEDEQGFETIEDLQRALKAAALDTFDQGADLPAVTYEISMVDLSATEAYKSIAGLEKVHLGDIVRCTNRNLDIETLQEVVELTFDCVTKRVTSLTLGEPVQSYFNGVNAKMDSTSETLENQKQNSIQYYTYKNAKEINIRDTATATVIHLIISAFKQTFVTFHAQLNLGVETTAIGTAYDDCRCRASIFVNGEERPVHPEETWQDGKHVLNLMDVFEMQAGKSIEYEVRLTPAGGNIHADEQAINAYFSGMGLRGMTGFNGTMHFTENVPALALPYMAVISEGIIEEIRTEEI